MVVVVKQMSSDALPLLGANCLFFIRRQLLLLLIVLNTQRAIMVANRKEPKDMQILTFQFFQKVISPGVHLQTHRSL